MAKQRKRRLKPYEKVAFTNELGHVINPGDGILAVTKSTASVHVYVGRYLGLRRNTRWNQDHVNVVVEYDLVDEYHAHNVTGKRWDWYYKPPGMARPNYPHVEYPSYPRLPWSASAEEKQKAQDEYNNKRAAADQKYKELQAEYQAKMKEWNDAIEAYKKANYTEVKKPYTQARTLQNNKIYPINMQMKELAKAA